ncbi:MAG: TetR/AcrR family transcriptional regulator [Hellea sp.]|nr:TetR/AcrR family transcriptional regulator [Hellea sp.]
MPAAQRAQMQARISEVAEALFTRDGYAKVSLRRIAKEIGCTPMALYGYYDSKFDILQSLWDGVFDQLFKKLGAITAPMSTPAASAARSENVQLYLQSLCTTYIEFWLERPDNYRLVFMAEGVTQPDVSLFLGAPDIVARYSLFQKTISRLCPNADGSKIKLKLDFMLSALHGIAHNNITISGYDWSSPEDQVGLVVKAVV